MKFSIKEEKGIIEAFFYSETSLAVFEEYLQCLSRMNLSAKVRILHDHRQAKPVLRPFELVDLVKLFRKHLSDRDEVKIAYVSNTPRGIALAMLFKDIIESPKFKVQVFAQKDTAINWLLTSNRSLLV